MRLFRVELIALLHLSILDCNPLESSREDHESVLLMSKSFQVCKGLLLGLNTR
jgi:hypothetical protein